MKRLPYTMGKTHYVIYDPASGRRHAHISREMAALLKESVLWEKRSEGGIMFKDTCGVTLDVRGRTSVEIFVYAGMIMRHEDRG